MNTEVQVRPHTRKKPGVKHSPQVQRMMQILTDGNLESLLARHLDKVLTREFGRKG